MSQTVVSAEHFETVLDQFSKAELHDQGWAVSMFPQLVNAQDATIRKRARDTLVEFVQRQHEESGRMFTNGSTLEAIELLCSTATEQDLDWIRDSVANQNRPGQAVHEVAALARLAPAEGLTILQTWLADRETAGAALRSANEVYPGSANTLVTIAIADADLEHDHEWESAFNLIGEIGAENSKAQTERLLVRLSNPALRSRLEASLSQGDFDAEAGGLSPEFRTKTLKLGLLDEVEIDTTLRKRQESIEEYGTTDPSPISMLELLMWAGATADFDVETGMFPNQHDELVLLFAESSRGRFQPSAVVETVLGDIENANYVLEFITNGQIYRGNLIDHGDWYDVERISAMIERALSDAGGEERFVGVATGDQTASFIFGNPKVIKALAAEGHFELVDDPNSSREVGQEFEREAIESLMKGKFQ